MKQGYTIIDCNTCRIDLQAISFLLEFSSVLAITVPDGPNNTLGRAYNNTLGILAYLDRTDVPVIKGCTGSERQGVIRLNKASVYLCQLTKQYKHKITIVCLGPLTNISEAVTYNKDFVRYVKRVVASGDGYWKGCLVPQLHFKADPAATATVLTSSLPLTLVQCNSKVSLGQYLAVREGTCGVYSALFEDHEDTLLAASQYEYPGYVMLRSQIAALVTLSPVSIVKKQCYNVECDVRGGLVYSHPVVQVPRHPWERQHKVSRGSLDSDTLSSLTRDTLPSSTPPSSTPPSSTLSTPPSSTLSSPISSVTSCNDTSLSETRRTVVVTKVRMSDMIKLYKKLYLRGMFGRPPRPY